MANVQKQFIEFHNAIKLDDENETLREKREIILKKLKNKITEDAPVYEPFVQGSYALSTGVKPIDGEYDIDVGLAFEMSKDDHKPVTAKQWVRDALDGHTDSVVVIKTPCITVTYIEDGEPAFHVDLTVYAAHNADGNTYLAKGRPASAAENKVWDLSDPKELMRLVRSHFGDAQDRAQFRRVIRYLKRWKDNKFDTGKHAAPTGIALTVAAVNYFSPSKVDPFTGKRVDNDLLVLMNFVNSLLDAFFTVINDKGEYVERLVVRVPTPNYDDLLAKMTDTQMLSFKNKLTNLRDALVTAEDKVDPVEACQVLQKQFGDDFPIPPKEETAQSKNVAVATGSASARD